MFATIYGAMKHTSTITDTENVSCSLQGGISTRDEMCLSFLVYYPRVEMSLGLSTITQEAFIEYLETLPLVTNFQCHKICIS